MIGDARAVEIRDDVKGTLEDALSYARDFMPRQQVFALGGVWKGLQWAGSDWSADTGRRPRELLERGRRAARALPDGFAPHPRVQKLLEQRHEMVQGGPGHRLGLRGDARLREPASRRHARPPHADRTPAAARSATATRSSTTTTPAPSTFRSTTCVQARRRSRS